MNRLKNKTIILQLLRQLGITTRINKKINEMTISTCAHLNRHMNFKKLAIVIRYIVLKK